MSRLLLLGLLGVCACSAPAWSQEDKKSEAPAERPAKSAEGEGPKLAADGKPSGRRPFSRDQGSAQALEAHLREVLTQVAKRYPDLPYPPPPPKAPERPMGGLGGGKPGGLGGGPPGGPAPEGKEDALLTTLRAWRPTRKVLLDVFSEEGLRTIGKRVWQAGKTRFERPAARDIVGELGLHPSLSEIKVYAATTEDLATMEPGTVAAREFASGLRGLTSALKPRYRYYVAVLDRPAAEKKKAPAPADRRDPADLRLQLWVKGSEGWVYLGRLWRIAAEPKTPQAPKAPQAPQPPGK